MIQPHLPIRLPCYDFTPVIGSTFGSSLLSKEKEVGIVLLLSIQRKQETAEMDMNLLVAMRLRETPVPIPNTTVKT